MCFIPSVSCLSIPACPHRPSRVTMDHHPEGSASPSWCKESNPSPHLFASTHSWLTHSSSLNPRYPAQASRQLKWKITFTPQQWHWDLRANPTGGCQSVDHSSLYSLQHPFPSVDPYKYLYHLNHLFLTVQSTKRNHWYRAWMGDSMGGLPGALQKSHRRTCSNLST